MPEKNKEPRICYGLLPIEMANPSLTQVTPIIVTEGESGYRLTSWKWDKELAEQACDAKNLALGISPAEAAKMMLASMFPKGKFPHTPRPWRRMGQGTLLHPASGAQITTERIETSLGYIEVFDQTNESEANMELITAAPNLLAALTDTLDALYNETAGEDDSPWIRSVKAKAKEAIAKAKGEHEAS